MGTAQLRQFYGSIRDPGRFARFSFVLWPAIASSKDAPCSTSSPARINAAASSRALSALVWTFAAAFFTVRLAALLICPILAEADFLAEASFLRGVDLRGIKHPFPCFELTSLFPILG